MIIQLPGILDCCKVFFPLVNSFARHGMPHTCNVARFIVCQENFQTTETWKNTEANHLQCSRTNEKKQKTKAVPRSTALSADLMWTQVLQLTRWIVTDREKKKKYSSVAPQWKFRSTTSKVKVSESMSTQTKEWKKKEIIKDYRVKYNGILGPLKIEKKGVHFRETMGTFLVWKVKNL